MLLVHVAFPPREKKQLISSKLAGKDSDYRSLLRRIIYQLPLL